MGTHPIFESDFDCLTEMVFKCITCCVQFDNIEDYRAHFQSEWHCYNLKRKVAGLPPVTKIDFEERKALAEQKQKDNTKIKGKKPKKEKKSKKNHKNVNKDFEEPEITNEEVIEPKWKAGDNPRYRWLCERARAMGLDEEDDDEWEDLSGDEEIVEEDDRAIGEEVDEGIDGINTAECVIDGINQREIPLNECFFSGHISDSIEANLKHMETKFGFFIPCIENLADRDGLLRYIARKIGVGNVCIWCNEMGKAFYSLAAVRQHMIEQGHCKLNMIGEKMFEYSDFYDFDSSDEEDEELDEGSVGEMVLKDGSVIGHRSMWKYFKQSFNPKTDLVLSKRQRQISGYRAIGFYDTHAERQYEKKQFKQAARWKKHHALALGLKNNKTMMTHFVRRDGFCQ